VTEHQGEALRLGSAENFRDVAGPGYATRDGDAVHRGVFYRSNALIVDDADADTLASAGLRAVLDLRSQWEIEQHPDRSIDGADWHHYDVLGIPLEGVTDVREPAQATEIMRQVYTRFVTDAGAREQFGGLFRQLATGGPQVFHCTHGKDRTGWVASLLLHIAGVDDATIVEDYLLSNEHTRKIRADMEDTMRALRGPDLVEIFAPAMVVDLDYLETAWDAVAREYGDRAAYLRDGLGLDDDTLGSLRVLLVG
jgi:protein-tyrosine phosphatase